MPRTKAFTVVASGCAGVHKDRQHAAVEPVIMPAGRAPPVSEGDVGQGPSAQSVPVVTMRSAMGAVSDSTVADQGPPSLPIRQRCRVACQPDAVVLQIFGDAMGPHANFRKCSITPIHCNDNDIKALTAPIGCTVCTSPAITSE